MKKRIPFIISVIICIFIFYANIFSLQAYSKAQVNLEQPKKYESKVSEEPDMLIPMPETPKEIKKKEKEAKKAMKKSSKKVKPEKYIDNKQIKKKSFESIKSEYNAPKTFDQYIEMAKEVKREDMKTAAPNFPKDDKLVNLPEPGLRVVKYNMPPGVKDLDLRQLMTSHQLVTQGVLSPDKTRMAYSVVYSYPTSEQVASEMFYIEIPKNISIMSALKNFHTIEAVRKPFLRAGTENLFQYEKRTFTILDWSEDGQKIAVKEKIGSQTQGPWKTQIWTYDFEENRGYELTAIREAIRYYWKNQYDLDLIDYMWDIYPLGWDLYNKDRIVVQAYVYAKEHRGAKFLGTWSIDYKNQRSELMSEIYKNFEVSVNGYCLETKHE